MLVHPLSPPNLELAVEANFCTCNFKSSKTTKPSEVLNSSVPADLLNFSLNFSGLSSQKLRAFAMDKLYASI